MNWLQIRLFGPVFSSFLHHSYGYDAANEPKTVLKHPNFRFSLNSPTTSPVPSLRWLTAGGSKTRLRLKQFLPLDPRLITFAQRLLIGGKSLKWFNNRNAIPVPTQFLVEPTATLEVVLIPTEAWLPIPARQQPGGTHHARCQRKRPFLSSLSLGQ